MTTSFTTPASSTERLKAARAAGLEPELLVKAFRLMQTSRQLDDREILLKRQQRIFFQISGAGHEAIQIAAGMVARPGYDWFYPYYRDRALCLTLGMTPYDMLLQAVGAADDPSSGGRQMPSHWARSAKNIVTSSSATGTQFVQAVGCAEGCRNSAAAKIGWCWPVRAKAPPAKANSGKSINQACLNRSPVLFLIEDNGWAISVPVERQTPGRIDFEAAERISDLLTIEVDGTDLISSYRAMSAAAAWCREGRGPALVHAHCIRPYSHSLSDDERNYKTAHEREEEAARDPLTTFPQFLIEEGVLDKAEVQQIVREIHHQILEDTHRALKAAPPAPETALLHLYSEKIDPTSPQFDAAAQPEGEARTMADLINITLKEEMRRDDRVIVFGEDVADSSREANLAEVKGKGGVFKVTAGLQIEFGGKRCFNTPIAEASIVGRAIGMATSGSNRWPRFSFSTTSGPP